MKTIETADFESYQQLFDPSFGPDMDLWSTLVPVMSSEEVDMGFFAT